MKKTIQKLRTKSHEEKQQIAFMGALIITAFIVMFYIAGLTAGNNVDESQAANTATPFESIKNEIKGIFQNK